jgi:hypothetical protein
LDSDLPGALFVQHNILIDRDSSNVETRAELVRLGKMTVRTLNQYIVALVPLRDSGLCRAVDLCVSPQAWEGPPEHDGSVIPSKKSAGASRGVFI